MSTAPSAPAAIDRARAETAATVARREEALAYPGGTLAEALRRERSARSGPNGAGQTRRLLDPGDPITTARAFLAELYGEGEVTTLRHHRGDFRSWSGRHYATLADDTLRGEVWRYLEAAERPAKNGAVPFKPSTTNVNEVVDALRGVTHLDRDHAAPAWLDGRADPDPRGLVPCRNGLLHLGRRRLLPHSPALLNDYALPFDYEPNAPEPREWLRFLAGLWPEDQEAVDTLQELFAYLLSGETQQQKIFLIVGPRRSGKGTIARTLKALMGPDNVAGPTLSAMTERFGLQALLGRPVAIIADARLSGRADQAVIAERLLSISGEDTLTIDRKHRDPETVQLPTRLILMTNELPRIGDTSGALASRFVVWTLTRSWLGREDPHLFHRLVGELPSMIGRAHV